MSTQKITLEDFNEIYNTTYDSVLKFLICNALNINDVNELVQDTYVELYKTLKKKGYIVLNNTKSFVIGIAKNKLRHHYTFLKLRQSRFIELDAFYNLENEMASDIDVEELVIKGEDAKLVWEYIKKKDIKVIRIFYLHFVYGLKIKDVAKAIHMTESNVKNILYRTINEIKENINNKGEKNV